MAHNATMEDNLPVLMTPEQLAVVMFQIDYDEKHLAHLRRHGNLPYVQFQINGRRVFRYPRDAVIEWIATRTHGAKASPDKAPPVHRAIGSDRARNRW